MLFVFILMFFSLTRAAEEIENHLKIALVELEPFCMKDSNGKEIGFLVDLLEDLLQRVNRSGTQSVTYSTHWLSLAKGTTEKRMWDIVRGALLNGESDLALVPLADTSGWNGVIQLSQPYLLAPIMALTYKDNLVNGKNQFYDNIRTGKIKGTYVSGSSTASLIEKDNRAHIQLLRELINVNNTFKEYPTYNQAFLKLQNQSNFVLFGEQLRFEYLLQKSKHCELTIDWEIILGIGAYTLPISLYVQSQALISSINMNLLDMRQDGTILGLKQKWWPSGRDECGRTVQQDLLDQYF